MGLLAVLWVAHEFSHILNRDMRLNIRPVGVLFGILMIGLIGRKILAPGRFGGRGKGAGGVLGVALVGSGPCHRRAGRVFLLLPDRYAGRDQAGQGLCTSGLATRRCWRRADRAGCRAWSCGLLRYAGSGGE